MKVFLIDNNLSPDPIGSPELQRMIGLAPGAEITVRRAIDQEPLGNPRGYDRVVISGCRASIVDDSPWLDLQIDFVRRVLDEGIPFLGVCHGHQSLARALGGKPAVRRAAAPEVGWTRFDVIGESPLFAGLGKKFVSFSSHNDEVCAFPAGLRNLASSEGCAVQAVQLGNRPVFGIQFHPEKDLELTRACFDEQLSNGTPKDKLLHPDESETLYDPRVGQTIFRNFLNLQAVY